MPASPIPIIICGRRAEIASSVRASMLPEFEVIHAVLSVEKGVTDIPILLNSQKMSPTAAQVGSQNYRCKPVAVVVGAGYEPGDIDQMRNACQDSVKIGVPWLRADMELKRPPVGPGYGKYITTRMKTELKSLGNQGKLGTGDDVFYY